MNDKISIRRPVPEDTDAIVSLVWGIQEDNPDEWDRDERLAEKVREILTLLHQEPDFPGFVRIAESKGEIIGYSECLSSNRVTQRLS